MAEKNLDNILQTRRTRPNKSNDVPKETSNLRYPALRTIAGFYGLLAWIVGFVTIGFSLYFISDENYIGLVVGLLLGILTTLGLMAIAEGIKVFLDIEQNTRKSSRRD